MQLIQTNKKYFQPYYYSTLNTYRYLPINQQRLIQYPAKNTLQWFAPPNLPSQTNILNPNKYKPYYLPKIPKHTGLEMTLKSFSNTYQDIYNPNVVKKEKILLFNLTFKS